MSSSEDPGRLLPSGSESGTAPEDRKFRPDVEGLRAVAILLVVLFHTGWNRMQGGFVGVDVFFVISGFVITGLLLRERQATDGTELLVFYARRARRILPLALLVIVISLTASAVFVGHSYAELVASDSRWTAVFLSNFHFENVLPTLFTVRPQSPLEQFWSLAVEEQFYLVYPAFFIALLAIPGRWSLRTRLAVGLIGVIMVSFFFSVTASKIGHFAGYYSPASRAWELAIGALVAVATRQLERIPVPLAAIATWLGLIGILYSSVELSERLAYPGYAAAMPVLSTALVIAGGSVVPTWGAEVILGWRPVQWVGRLSYGWYLWHWPLLVIVAERSHRSVFETSVRENLLLVVVALGIAIATYFIVENPIRHSRWLTANPRVSVLGGILLVSSCVVFTYLF